jgi:hypothetical protein
MQVKGALFFVLATVFLSGCFAGDPPPLPTRVLAPGNPTALATLGLADPTATVTPTPRPPTPTPTPTLPPVEGLCYQPYYPARTDTTWVYRTSYASGGYAPVEYTLNMNNIVRNQFTEQRKRPNSIVESVWSCSDEGLTSTQLNALLFVSPIRFDFITVKSTGVTLPALNRFTVGRTWNNNYEVTGQVQVSADGGTALVQGDIRIANKIIGAESITVPAGTFTAMRIDSTISMALTASKGQYSLPVNFSIKASAWLAENVGQIKFVTTGDVSTTTELASVSRSR